MQQSNQQQQQKMELMTLQRQIDESDINDPEENITLLAEGESSKPPTTIDYSSMNEQDANFHKFFFPTDSEAKNESDVSPSSTVVEQVKHNKKKT